MANQRVRIIDTATKPVIIIDRASEDFAKDFAPDGAVVLVFADEVDLGDERIAAQVSAASGVYGSASGRVPAGELRRPDLPGQRHPEDDLGTEALPG